ncbi:acyltransferase 3 [Aspergillus coremiiformis]|uniref:Acyltransferase 3 n=1 Tax=Aspergillus coremiiformis TaxID=138285 RepID=A0A5N6YY09_9EURO|nr:acyltransferase 3 [Aspergillus coremiiformis]
MERTKWLDGLRGVAAAIVAVDHFFMGEVWHPFISFWADPPESNRRLVQLPPIRILFSAHAMVALFMVISGYAISINILKARSTPQFYTRISSAVLRRVFRIYLPVLIISTISQLLFFFNLYHWTFDEDLLRGLKPWTAPWAHIKWLFIYMADSINIIAFAYNGGFNGQLWTMPVEFRGSNVVFVLLIGLSAWRPTLRLWFLPVLALYFLWYGIWDTFGFTWGLWLAERACAHPPEATLPSFPTSSEKPRLFSRKNLTVAHITTALAFLLGYHLLCLSDDGVLPAGYRFLAVFHPAKWHDDWQLIQWCWKSVGAAAMVYAIGESRLLQRPFLTRPVQYLGKISFSLYLVHQAIYHLWRDPVRDYLWLLGNGSPYPGSVEATVRDPMSFHMAWWASGAILGTVVVYAAHYWTLYVDNKCVAFTKRVERWLTVT